MATHQEALERCLRGDECSDEDAAIIAAGAIPTGPQAAWIWLSQVTGIPMSDIPVLGWALARQGETYVAGANGVVRVGQSAVQTLRNPPVGGQGRPLCDQTAPGELAWCAEHGFPLGCEPPGGPQLTDEQKERLAAALSRCPRPTTEVEE